MSDAYAINDLDRRLANMIRFGTIDEVDLDEKKATVKLSDDETTEWLPWTTGAAGKTKTWRAPDVGEQVVVLSPGGDLTQGVIGPSLYWDDFEAPGSDADKQVLKLDDNATLSIEVGDSRIEVTKDEIKIHAKSGGSVKIGNNPTKHAATGEDTKTMLDHIKTYLTTMAAVFSSPIPEAGMGAPSSLGTALNVAHQAAKPTTLDMIQEPSASEVLVK